MIYKLGEKTPKIGENNYIAENATVIGEVVTNENVSIWFGAVVRADMSKVTVGRDSNTVSYTHLTLPTICSV